MTLWQDFTKGIIKENPIFRVMLGLCPTLAVTTSAINGVGMGLATSFVLLGSNLLISSLRKAIPFRIRIPSYIVIIATFVTITDLMMHAYLPQLHKALGLFIPLIVVNCIILGRAEAFASRHPVVNSTMDALGMGVGFTLALVILGSIRQLIGSGGGMIIMLLPPGALLTIGLLLALANSIARRKR